MARMVCLATALSAVAMRVCAHTHMPADVHTFPTSETLDELRDGPNVAGVLCANSSAVGDTCVLSNLFLELTTPFYLTVNGSVSLINITILHVPCETTACMEGNVAVTAGADITVAGSYIQAPSILLQAGGNLTVDNASTLAANGMGPTVSGVAGADGISGTGGGHGGVGAYIWNCHDHAPQPANPAGQAFGMGNLQAPYYFGGASSGFDSGVAAVSRGGGRVWLQANVSAVVWGMITANGQDGAAKAICHCGAGGGAGGSIFVGASVVDVCAGYFSATGGSSYDAGGGGGGIISFNGDIVVGASASGYNVTGGVTLDSAQWQGCPIASPGLVYIAQSYGDASAPWRKVIPPFRPPFAAVDRPTALMPVHAPSPASQLWRAHARQRYLERADAQRRCADYFAMLQVRQPVDASSAGGSDGGSFDASFCERMHPWLHEGDNTPSATLTCISQTAAQRTNSPLMQTPLYALADVTDIVLNNCAWLLTPSLPALLVNSLSMSGGDIATQRPVTQFVVATTVSLQGTSRLFSDVADSGIVINAESVRLTRSLLSAGTIDVYANDVNIGTQAFVHFSFGAAFQVVTMEVSNSVSQVDLPMSITTVEISATNVTLYPNSIIQADRVFIVSTGQLIVNGLVSSTQTMTDPSICPFQGSGSTLSPVVASAPCALNGSVPDVGFTIWLASPDLEIWRSGLIQGPVIRMCSLAAIVQDGGVVSAAGLGCAANYGPGAGQEDSSGAASGAGHGGAGGMGRIGNDKMAGGPAYDNVTYPRMLGSGGGDVQDGGAGGGLIWIETWSLYLAGSILGSGVAGQGNGGSGVGGGGGGSGGSFVLVIGNLTGPASGIIDFSGGAGGGPGGGGGGGGVMNVAWDTMGLEAVLQNSAFLQLSPRHMYAAVWGGPPLAATSAADGAWTSRLQLWNSLESTVLRTSAGGAVAAWSDIPMAPPSVLPILSFAGQLNNAGGAGAAPGTAGAHGVAVSSPTCGAGQGGALCLPCAPGWAKNYTGDNSPCIQCPPGTFSNSSGSTNCTACAAGTVAPVGAATFCNRCPTGYQPNWNHTTCSMCAPGYAGPPCMLCPAGTISVAPFTVCIPCAGGTYADDDQCYGCPDNTFAVPPASGCTACPLGSWSFSNASRCRFCPSKPAHAHWLPNTPVPPSNWSVPSTWAITGWSPPGTCRFDCDAGFLSYPLCITPVEAAYRAIGGYITFSIAFGLTCLSSMCIVFCYSGPTAGRRKRVARRRHGEPEVQLWLPAAGAGLPVAFGVDAYWDAPADGSGRASCCSAWCCSRSDVVDVQGGAQSDDPQPPTLHETEEDLEARAAAVLSLGDPKEKRTLRGRPAHAASSSTFSHGSILAQLRLDGSILGASAADDLVEPLTPPAATRGSLLASRTVREGSGGASLLSARHTRSNTVASHDAGVPGSRSPAVRGRMGSAIDLLAAASIPTNAGDTGARAAVAQMTLRAERQQAPPVESGLQTAPTADTAAAHRHGSPLVGVPVAGLARHVHRIFFAGTNTPADPLRLPPRIPPELAAMLSPVEFAEHARDCASLGEWKPWEINMSNALRAACLPLALVFEESRRAARIKTLMEFHAEHNHAFLRNTRAQALGNCVFFGASKDHTLAWLDILASELEEDTGGAPIGQPRLPAVVPISGNGSYATPYSIDIRDPLTAATAALICPDFVGVIVALNNLLRRVQGPTMAPCLVDRDALLAPGARRRRPRPPARGQSQGSINAAYAAKSSLGGRLGGLETDAWGADSPSYTPLLDGPAEAWVGEGEDEQNTPESLAAVSKWMALEASAAPATVTNWTMAANAGPVPLTQRALKFVQEFLSVVNDTLAQRSREAKAAADHYRACVERYDALAAAAARPAFVPPARRGSVSTSITAASSGSGSASTSQPGAAGAVVPPTLFNGVGGAREHGISSNAAQPSFQTAGRVPSTTNPPGGSSLHRVIAATTTPTATPGLAVHTSVRTPTISVRMSAPPTPAPAVDESQLAAAADAVVEAEATLAEAVRLMPFGFPDYECSLHLGRTEAVAHPDESRLCLLLLPRSAPAPESDGSWPYYLPYNSRPLPANAAISLGLLKLALRASLGSTLRGTGVRPPSHRLESARGAGASRADASPVPELAVLPHRASQASHAPTRASSPKRSSKRRCAAVCAEINKALANTFLTFPMLVNARAIAPAWMTTLAMSIMVAIDMCGTLLLLSGLFDLIDDVASVAILVPPLVLPLAPVVAWFAIIFSSPRALRFHAAFALLSMLPVVVALCGAATRLRDGVTDYLIGLVVPAVLLAEKWAFIRVTHFHVAVLEMSQALHASSPTAIAFVRSTFLTLKGMPQTEQ